jgi:hypothetical protein
MHDSSFQLWIGPQIEAKRIKYPTIGFWRLTIKDSDGPLKEPQS